MSWENFGPLIRDHAITIACRFVLNNDLIRALDFESNSRNRQIPLRPRTFAKESLGF
jgi:hypothetical protein